MSQSDSDSDNDAFEVVGYDSHPDPPPGAEDEEQQEGHETERDVNLNKVISADISDTEVLNVNVPGLGDDDVEVLSEDIEYGDSEMMELETNEENEEETLVFPKRKLKVPAARYRYLNPLKAH